jgi:hypothetical protein
LLDLFILQSDVRLCRLGVPLDNHNFGYSPKEAVKKEEELILEDPSRVLEPKNINNSFKK